MQIMFNNKQVTKSQLYAAKFQDFVVAFNEEILVQAYEPPKRLNIVLFEKSNRIDKQVCEIDVAVPGLYFFKIFV